MRNPNEMSDEELIAARNKLLERQKNLSGLPDKQLIAQYKQLGGQGVPKEQLKPLWQRAVSAEAQGLGNVIQNIGKTTGLISKEAEPWKIRQALGVTTEPTGYEKFVTGATENVLPFALPALRLAKGAGALANIINRGTLPALYYKLQGKSTPESISEGYGGAALPEVIGPALKAGLSAGKQIVKPIIKGAKEGYASVKNLPAYQQELQNIANAEQSLTNELLPNKFAPEEGRTLTHEENIFKLANEKLAEKQASLGKEYQEFKSLNQDKEITMPTHQEQASNIIEQMQKEPTFSELFGVGMEPEEQAYKVNRQILPDVRKANTLFDNYRSLTRLAQRAMGKARAKGVDLTPDERAIYEAASQKYNKMANELGDVIKDAGYGESLENIKKINKKYADEYAPIYKTSIYWNMLKEGKSPSNFLKEITGLTAGKKIFRDLVKGNPELRKAAIGQHAKTSEGLVARDEVLEPYLQAEKDLAQRTKNYKEALKNKPKLEKKVSQATKLKNVTLGAAATGLGGLIGGEAFKIGSK